MKKPRPNAALARKIAKLRSLGCPSEKDVAAIERILDRSLPRWIPVGEQLPKPFSFVWSYWAFGEPQACARRFDGERWSNEDETDAFPTYWMPIPDAPPKGSK